MLLFTIPKLKNSHREGLAMEQGGKGQLEALPAEDGHCVSLQTEMAYNMLYHFSLLAFVQQITS